MTIINGSAAEGAPLRLSPHQEQALQLLDLVRQQVMAGQVSTIGICSVGAAGAGSAVAGTDAGGLMIATKLLEQKIMMSVMGPPSNVRASPILRPGQKQR